MVLLHQHTCSYLENGTLYILEVADIHSYSEVGCSSATRQKKVQHLTKQFYLSIY